MALFTLQEVTPRHSTVAWYLKRFYSEFQRLSSGKQMYELSKGPKVIETCQRPKDALTIISFLKSQYKLGFCKHRIGRQQ